MSVTVGTENFGGTLELPLLVGFVDLPFICPNGELKENNFTVFSLLSPKGEF